VYIVGIGGTTNPKSVSEVVLRRALGEAERLGAQTRAFTAADIDFPLYTEDAERAPAVLAFLSEIERCNGLIVVSPAYHGTITGRIKNALDYIEDLKSSNPPYLENRIFGCIGVGGGHLGAVLTVDGLRTVAHALRAWPAPMGLGVSSHEPITAKVEEKLFTIVRQVMSPIPVLQ
jgi:FMN reductase